ncbi:hypothetical protein U9M48_038100 [Paspalum notatum var. saurae]|uniref:ACT domain-containing protein ACR n=1 Tax=Paspalum notatum var. saurae TaxID=547442 RepID=A0AAQ3XA04_PASNO
MMASGSRSRSNEMVDEFEKLVIRMNPPRVTVDNDSDMTATLVKASTASSGARSAFLPPPADRAALLSLTHSHTHTHTRNDTNTESLNLMDGRLVDLCLQVDSANKYGTLLEVVQVLTDLKLTIKRAYISSDGEWFMDVFHVVDQDGNKLYDGQVIDKIEQVNFMIGQQGPLLVADVQYYSYSRTRTKNRTGSYRCNDPYYYTSFTANTLIACLSCRDRQSLGAGSLSFRAAPERAVGVEAEAEDAQTTTIELVGRDRPGLLSEVFAVLTDLRCNIVASEVWTHDARVAALVHVTDAGTGGAIADPARLDTAKRLLRHVLRGSSRDKKAARAAVSARVEHAQRRLHQIMHADRGARRGVEEAEEADAEDDGDSSGAGSSRPLVAVEDCAERGYTLVNVRCRDRPKLLFDTVCTLTDMQYVVFHGTVIAEGAEAYQEYYIRHLDDSAGSSSGDDRALLCRGLEAAIQRRYTEGLRLELCCEDRVGLLSDVTRIFREHGLSVTHAEVDTRGARAANVFYVVDASGQPLQAQAVDAVRAEIGHQVLFVREPAQDGGAHGPRSPTGAGGRRSLGNMIRSRSEKFLYNLGLIRSCS